MSKDERMLEGIVGGGMEWWAGQKKYYADDSSSICASLNGPFQMTFCTILPRVPNLRARMTEFVRPIDIE